MLKHAEKTVVFSRLFGSKERQRQIVYIIKHY